MKNSEPNQTEQIEWGRLEAAAEQSRLAWRRLKLGLISITPKDWVRLALLLAFTAVVGRIIWVAWSTLIPFVVGGVIAYMLLPTVNRLNRFMPRLLAVIITLTAVVFFVSTFVTYAIAPISNQIYRGYLNIPSASQIETRLSELDQYIRTLPVPTQNFIDNLIERTVTNVRANVDTYLNEVVSLSVRTTLRIFNTVGFLLGFLAVPAWLLTVLVDQKRAKTALDQLLPTWLRPDFWAVVRIIDRTFSAFLRGQLALAFAVGLLLYGFLSLMPQIGLPDVNYKILLAIFAGVMQLIPSIGPFLGIIPFLLVGFTNSPQTGFILILLFILVQAIVMQTVAPYVERRVYDLHPAIMVIIIVALSTFGWWWVILAAPVTGTFYDLMRYLLGRLSTPPRPAGLLPKEPLPQPAILRNQRPRPSVYRRLGSGTSTRRSRN